jgi:tol-pal system protein YbgF
MIRRPIALTWLVLAAAYGADAWAAAPREPVAPVVEAQSAAKSLDDRMSRLEAKLQSSGLLDLLNQVNELRQEVAELRGIQEQQAHDLDQLDRRQKDVYADLDTRIRALSSRPGASTPESVRLQPSETLSVSPPPGATDDEGQAYELALGLFRAGNYKGSVTAFQNFLNKFPDATLASNACYWMGLGQASLGDFKAATQSYEKVLKDYPSSHKVPDAMLSLARIHIQQGEMDVAQDLLGQVVSKHPTSRAADNARKLLATLK